MSDDTIEEIERHNVLCARRIVEYWLKQGVRIELPNDPTKCAANRCRAKRIAAWVRWGGRDPHAPEEARTARLARHPYPPGDPPAFRPSGGLR